MIQFYLGIFLCLICTKISPADSICYFIVWNVGQGQWTTLVTFDECIHFDMGGERFPLKKIEKFCHKKNNFTYLSHSDWDHINGLKRWQKTCLMNRPWAKPNSQNEKVLNRARMCFNQPLIADQIKIVNHQHQSFFNKNKLNDSSLVFYLKKWQILIPGDSTTKAELAWAKQNIIQNTELLVLGHHGSKTSTSSFLLQNTKKLRNAVVSSRFKKYGHPHQVVIDRLKKYKINILTTEKFGNLIFQLN